MRVCLVGHYRWHQPSRPQHGTAEFARQLYLVSHGFREEAVRMEQRKLGLTFCRKSFVLFLADRFPGCFIHFYALYPEPRTGVTHSYCVWDGSHAIDRRLSEVRHNVLGVLFDNEERRWRRCVRLQSAAENCSKCIHKVFHLHFLESHMTKRSY